MSRHLPSRGGGWQWVAQGILVGTFFLLLFAQYLLPLARGQLAVTWWTWVVVGFPLFVAAAIGWRWGAFGVRGAVRRRLQSNRGSGPTRNT